VSGPWHPAAADGRIDMVFLDIGGVVYDDARFARAILLALRDLGADVRDTEFTAAYDELRQRQTAIARGLAARFLPEGEDWHRYRARIAAHWDHPPEALYPDVRDCLSRLRGAYRLGVIANQKRAVLDAMARDGLTASFEVLAISGVLGVEKPDPRIYETAVAMAGVPPGRAVHVGNRLDTDVRPARSVGLRTVWVLRGEAPPSPTPEQLAEPDGWVRSLAELPGLLDRLATA